MGEVGLRTVERFANPGYGGHRPAHFGGGGGCGPVLWNAGWRAQNNDLYIRPIVAWLEAQVGGLAAFHAGVERWIQRLRWFGSEGSEEAFYQNDFARFLFDSGVEMEDIGREAYAAGTGRVDFLLRGNMFVPVELKLWRGAVGNGRLAAASAPAQAARYVRDFQVPRGYLVVVVANGATERLELPRDGRTTDGVELLIRSAEVRPPSPSTDKRKVVSRSLTDPGLHAH